MSAPDDLDAWLRLLRTPGLSRAAARRLLAAFGSPEAALSAPPSALAGLVDPALATALRAADANHPDACSAVRTWLADGPARHVLTLADAGYPRTLLETPDPPLLLYAQGRLDALQAPALSIVGSRNPTPQGLQNARDFSAHLARSGLVIVSGLALGIDGAAHEGALAADGLTVAVMGTGPDRIYPARHRELAHRIVEHGVLLTEFEPGAPPLAPHFPQRNRLIAGLARGTLVVEAALASGSLSTARAATDAGREVFAIPGSIHAPQSRGCHWLIKQGAKLVESADDVLGEIDWRARPQAAQRAALSTGTQDSLLEAMGHDPVTLDALAARTGEPAAALGARLLELELEGHVARLPGGLFQRQGLG
ncbi:MAG TPA: DNA-processing protein DprA [Burkholderiaceae bacterium]|nr:DNA-processing protein DprA [Burkholderiaceae bacterium]